MSLRLIISFLVFVLLTIYFTYLNPGHIEVRLSQNKSVEIPVVAFLLVSILLGALFTSVFTGFHQIKESFRSFLKTRSWENSARRQKRWDKLCQKADNAAQGEHRDKALSLLKKILDENPDHIPSLMLLGNLYRQLGKAPEAVAAHNKAVEKDGDNPAAFHCLAEDYAAAGQTAKAIEALKHARHLEPDSLFTLRKLRQAYREQGDWNQVLLIQKSILSHVSDPQERNREKEYSGEIAYFRACELLKKNLTDPAISEFKRAIKESPRALPSYIQLGDLYQANDNLKAAVRIWKSGFENTGSHICLLRLRQAYEKLNKPEEIIKLYREAVGESQNSEKETLALALAEMYIEQGQMEEAMQTLWNISSPSIPAHLLLIRAHQGKNERDKADQVIRAALKKVTTSMTRLVCRQCHREFDQWSGVCPNCRAWNSFDTALHQTL